MIKMIDGGITEPLFDVEPVAPQKRPGPDARRTAVFHLRAEYGYNPLRNVPAHPDAPVDATPKDLHPRDYTCGTCVWANPVEHGGTQGGKQRVSLKCTADNGRWVTFGPATTIARWWPACPEWERRPQPT